MLDQSELISVIVPIFNVESYLDRCIDSIVHQTYTNLEIILVDDGSTDQSYEKALQWKQKDNRILLLKQNHGGAGAGRNSGLKIATGKYISFIDSDDYLEADMYDTLLTTQKKDNAQIVIGAFEIEGMTHCNDLPQIIRGNNQILEYLLLGKINHPLWNKLFDHSLLIDILFTDDIIAEDFLFLFEALKKCSSLASSKKVLYHYCIRDGSLCHTDIRTNYTYISKSRSVVAKQLEEMELSESIGLLKFHLDTLWEIANMTYRIRKEYGFHYAVPKQGLSARKWIRKHFSFFLKQVNRFPIKDRIRYWVTLFGLSYPALTIHETLKNAKRRTNQKSVLQ